MRILYIIHDNKKGGAAQSFLDMIRRVAQHHEVYVITPHKKGYVPSKLDELNIYHKSVYYSWWEIAKTGSYIVDMARFMTYRILNACNHIEAVRIAKIVKNKKIDIIHSNSSVISIGALVSELTGVPHVWHLREIGDEDFSLKPVRKKWDLNRTINIGDTHYIAISQYVKEYYKKVINFPDRIHVVYNGISVSYNYRKCEDNYKAKDVVFLISGNYCEEKGQIDVALAIEMLVSQKVSNFKVYMAGNGNFIEVKRFLSNNGLTGFVNFCGLVNDMQSLRKECDVEIVASRAEAFGRVTIEAMRASNPVIGSATGGTKELIQDGVTGFLYEYKEYKSLAECMRRFIDDPSVIFEMGQKAYEWSIDRFTSEENERKILDVYDYIRQ